MDVFAHTLWAGAGLALAARHVSVTRRTVLATLALAALPDLLQFVPFLAWVQFGDGSWTTLAAHATALPGAGPPLPPGIEFVSHQLHCIGHSALYAGALTWLVWLATRAVWLPLLGLWTHVLIDVFTHSAVFYPSPVLYPITRRGFDGIAWNEPWFMAANYVALIIVGAWLGTRRRIA